MDTPSRLSRLELLQRAARLAYKEQFGHGELFTSYVHVPLGILFLLTCTFALDLLITNYFPFSFPAPVFCAALFLLILLLLDWLSLRFPDSPSCTSLSLPMCRTTSSSASNKLKATKSIHSAILYTAPVSTAHAHAHEKHHSRLQHLPHITPLVTFEAKRNSEETADAQEERDRLEAQRRTRMVLLGQNEEEVANEQRRRFVDPVMKLLETPCLFCLKHMSVMFTPSFILIPAREQTLPGKEIGLIISWFTLSQALAFIIPILLHWFISWGVIKVHKARGDDDSSQTSDDQEITVTDARRAQLNDLEKGVVPLSNSTTPGPSKPPSTFQPPEKWTGAVLTQQFSSSGSTSLAPFHSRNVSESPSMTTLQQFATSQNADIHALAKTLGQWSTPLVYLTILIISIPFFYISSISYSLPLFLAVNLFTYLLAIIIPPPKIKRYAHPILTCSFVTVMLLWGLGAIKGLSLKQTLGLYSTRTKYTDLWAPGFKGRGPGAGDILVSTLDAGIVALAVPMYRYRRDLKANFARLMSIILPSCMLALFLWPLIAHRGFKLDTERSLAFAARFMSTPLAIELVNTVDGDESICVILVVVTGIVSAILKEWFFYKVMRVKKDDFLCVGMAMGVTSGAIGANSLLHEPRTMAIASLTFVLYGAILLALVAVPSIVTVVRSLAGG